ncbi:hypothetical protein JD844_000326 [Phrynosoma platyrhinos]|uniref:RNA helicase n=1 Tax=Phrynosoma platyrhinos TaxID=52577 RepID=A0ABQ7SQM3_PHRPL|nr:hypothetical protein JD844_000326 [Phrynosoma platyrhinos]
MRVFDAQDAVSDIENPGCFWVGIKGGGNFVDNEMEYKKLQSYMNQFYNKYNRCLHGVKPSVLEKGQVCAVYCEEQKSWCRAIVKSITSCTDYYLAECFLVDYAKSIPVKKEKYVMALKTTSVEAKLCAVEDDTFDVYLYVTINGEKVCVNDDLVAKNFACYEMNEKTFHIMEDQTPKMLNLKSLTATEDISPACVLWPMLLYIEESKALEMCEYGKSVSEVK